MARSEFMMIGSRPFRSSLGVARGRLMALALARSSFRCRHYIDAFTAGRCFVYATSVDRVASVAIQYACKVRTTPAHVTEQEPT